MKRDTEIPHLAALRDTRLLTPWAGLRTCEQGGLILPLSSAFPWFTQWHVAGPTNSLTVAWAASALPANGKRTDFPFHSARWLSGGAPKALLRTYNCASILVRTGFDKQKMLARRLSTLSFLIKLARYPEFLYVKPYALRQRQLAAVINGIGGAAHVGFPGIGP